METRTSELGSNRTGIRTSPGNAEELLQAASAISPPPGDVSSLGEVRLAYIAEADALGSVPPPKSLKGAAKAALKMATGKRPQAFIDKLAERLAFERSGLRLYDALIVKHRAYVDELENIPVARIEEIRAEELRHFGLLNRTIEQLGGDPTAQTPCADVTGVEGLGLVQVLTDPRTTFAQSLHAILVAELTDVDGWAMLISLALVEGHDELAKQFEMAHHAEELHLSSVRRWLEDLNTAEAKVIKPS